MAWPFGGSGRKLEQKAIGAGGGGAFFIGSGSGVPSKSPKQYITEGYQFNVVVFRAAREIIQAAASINIELYDGDNLVEQHPVLDLLQRPNPGQSWDQFLAENLVNRMILGEMFIDGGEQEQPAELWSLLPLDMTVLPNKLRLPEGFIYKKGEQDQKTYEADPATGKSQIFFLKLYNPLNNWRGQSPLMAAALAADTFNAGSIWNMSLLKNSARPSGIIKFKGAMPSGEELQKFRRWFRDVFQGSQNAGEIPVLANDSDWVKLSESPRDMDFQNSMKESAKLVASALGVPIPLIDNDASTFNNMSEAKERLYTDTVIPIMEEFITSFGNWLLPRYGDNLSFKLDLDSIPALESVRERKFKRTSDAWNAGIITKQEAREALGYEPEADGDFKQAASPFGPPHEQQEPQQKSMTKMLAELAYGRE